MILDLNNELRSSIRPSDIKVFRNRVDRAEVSTVGIIGKEPSETKSVATISNDAVLSSPMPRP